MGTTQRIANFIAGARYEDIPQPAIDMARKENLSIRQLAMRIAGARGNRKTVIGSGKMIKADFLVTKRQEHLSRRLELAQPLDRARQTRFIN